MGYVPRTLGGRVVILKHHAKPIIRVYDSDHAVRIYQCMFCGLMIQRGFLWRWKHIETDGRDIDE